MENKREIKRTMLNNMTVNELRAKAKAQGIKGVSRAKKYELIAALMNGTESELTVEISTVRMYAFTGMYIGEFEAEVENGKIIVNTASKGELVFDLNTGKEITTEAKARYANKVERA